MLWIGVGLVVVLVLFFKSVKYEREGDVVTLTLKLSPTCVARYLYSEARSRVSEVRQVIEQKKNVSE